MKKLFWKLTAPQRKNFLQVLHNTNINENIKLILKNKVSSDIKDKNGNAK